VSDLLLDTHVLLWATSDPGRLGPRTTSLLTDPATRVVVSAVSVAELAIKRSIGKLTMTAAISELLVSLAADELALTVAHAEAVERLPLLHRDPFDRLLAGQAAGDDLILVTADDRLLAYPVHTLDARR